MDTSPTRSLVDRILGRKAKDIELPNESGKTDKRLPKKKKSQLDNMSEGFKIFKSLGSSKTKD